MTRQRVIAIAGATIVAIGSVATGGCAGRAEQKDDANRIVAPSEYVEDIEDGGAQGGVEDEVDSADAQAEAAERKAAEAKKKAEEAAKRLEETSGH